MQGAIGERVIKAACKLGGGMIIDSLAQRREINKQRYVYIYLQLNGLIKDNNLFGSECRLRVTLHGDFPMAETLVLGKVVVRY
jgi:hypothetical protein